VYNLDNFPGAIPGYAILNSAIFELCIFEQIGHFELCNFEQNRILNSVIFDIMDCQVLNCLASRLPRQKLGNQAVQVLDDTGE
jgi:hypothetical protein